MAHAQIHGHKLNNFVMRAVIVATVSLIGSACRAQAPPAGQTPEMTWAQELDKYPGLLNEFGELFLKLQHDVQFPAPRGESRLLPLLPQSTISYAAFPNYGDVANQTLKVFRQALKESPVLRDWWEHGQVAAFGPKVEDSLDKFYQFGQYLGGEIVVSATMEGREPRALILAEVRKPGLKQFLQQTVEQLAGKSKPGVRILDLPELTNAKESRPQQELVILVRPDFVVGAFDLATLRNFNARLDQRSREFASTPFGQRVVHEYQGGVTVLAAADLHTILSQASPSTEHDATFQYSGFADMKYLIWEHKTLAGQRISQTELSFSAARRGLASWLAKPSPLNSLDFVSPKALLAGTLMLTNPAQIFEDVKELEKLSNSNSLAAVPQFEQALHLSVKDDLLSLLGGELTLELDSVTPPQPAWRAILAVRDAKHLQQTLTTLMSVAHMEPEQVEDGGLTYYTVRIPSGNTTMQIGYAFLDGYLVIGSSRDAVAEAVHLHRSGGALAKSKKFLASLPPGHSLDASALIYQDPVAMMALRFGQAAPQIAQSFEQYSSGDSPSVICVYGEETAIREASTSTAFDAGAVLIVAAIAIPNLLRSRIAANEASAVGSLRTVNTAQVVYATTYPQKGYAPNLANLGPDPRGPDAVSPGHFGLIDESLTSRDCTGDGWCTKSGFRFKVTSFCKQGRCDEYVAVATPVSSGTGIRSFCSTSDGVIRSKTGPPLTSPLPVSECKAWSPLQ